MGTMWKTLKMAGVVIGPLMFIGSVALAARDIAEWGLQWYWWAAIGGGIFFASSLAIIWGQQKEMGKLQAQIDNQNQGQELLNRLERLDEAWINIMSHVPATGSEFHYWKEEYASWKDKASLCTKDEPQTRDSDYKREGYNEEHKSLLAEGDVIWDKIRVMMTRLMTEL